MSTPKEIEREQTDRLHELLLIKKHSKEKNIVLDMAISRAKATMSKESIAWVEKNIKELDEE